MVYSRELVDEFGHIVAWEKEDLVEPGKPNAAGWILPSEYNIHRRYPEVAILGVSRSSMKPVWDGHEFQPRLMLPLSLSYDHRVIDGAAAARFTRFLASRLEDLRRLTL